MNKIFEEISDIWDATKEKWKDLNALSFRNTDAYHLPIEKPSSPYGWIPDKAENFESRAKRCAMGDLKSMLWMFQEFRGRLTAEYKTLEKEYFMTTTEVKWNLMKRHFKMNDKDFFHFQAANLWLNRAALYGSEKAETLLKEYPLYKQYGYFSDSFQLPGNSQSKHCKGSVMKRLGFLDFDEKVSYSLQSLSNDRVYVGSCYVSYDGPDESGFGMEDEDDYYYFDEFFRLLYILRRWSTRDIRINQDSIVPVYKEKAVEQQKKRDRFWERYKNDAGMERYHFPA